MVTSCAALNCTARATRGNGITFHRFPRNLDLREKWLVAMNRTTYSPSPTAKLCGHHFKAEDFVRHFGQILLKKDAVPSIFNLVKKQANSKSRRLNKKIQSPSGETTDNFSKRDVPSNSLEHNYTNLKPPEILISLVQKRRDDQPVNHIQYDYTLEDSKFQTLIKLNNPSAKTTNNFSAQEVLYINCDPQLEHSNDSALKDLRLHRLNKSTLEKDNSKQIVLSTSPEHGEKNQKSLIIRKRRRFQPLYFGEMYNLRIARLALNIASKTIQSQRKTIKQLKLRINRLKKRFKSK